MNKIVSKIKIFVHDWKILRDLEKNSDFGTVLIQRGPARTGKTIRANKWAAKDHQMRRVVEGDKAYAEILASRGLSVVLNLNY